MSIANKIKPKIQKVINRFPTTVTIFRNGFNEFNEPIKDIKIVEVTGFYHDSTSSISSSTSVSESGSVIVKTAKYLTVILDEETVKIKENDFLYLDDIKYRIADLGNKNRFNIYYDLLLEEVV